MRIFDKSYSIVGFVLRIIGILIVLGLLIWGIASFIGLFTDDASAPAPNKTGTSSQQSGESGSTISQPNQPTTSKAPSSSSTTTSGKTTSGGHTSSTSTQIPNSGPGDVFAIFLVAVAVGYAGYQISLRKRLQS